MFMVMIEPCLTMKDHMEPVAIQLPNKFGFLDRLRDVLSLLYDSQDDPSVRTLSLLLNSIIEKQESLF